ncbi:MAG: class I adenylate-forming enzyme family protein [Alphaproteobacteria bacterium]
MHPIQFFLRRAIATPDSVAIEDGGRRWTYRALAERVLALAAGFQAVDPAPGGRVGLSAYNGADHVIALLATLAAGKIWVPLYPRNGRQELERMVDFTGPSIIVADAESRDAFDTGGARRLVIAPDSAAVDTLEGLAARHAGKTPEPDDRPLSEPAAIKFTGGSTGAPKGVMQPARAWNANIVSQLHHYGLGAGDRYLGAAPITHGTSTYILPTLAAGGTIVVADRLKSPQLLEALRRSRATFTFLPPTAIDGMLDTADDAPCPALRHLIYAGAPMRPERIAAAITRFGPVLATSYGQTEAPQIITVLPAAELAMPENRAGVGRASLLTEVAILDGDGRRLPAGETGEVCARGDLVMSGYWRNPEKTAETLVGGWLRTGDLGTLDARGHLTLRGRSREVVISGGFNVYPIDVEAALGRHPDIADVAVFGVEDAKWGEAVHAAVVLRAGAGATAADLIAFARDAVGPIKAPKAVHLRGELPKNAFGKVLKPQLRREAEGR